MNLAMLLEMAADGGDGRVALGSRLGGRSAADLLVCARRGASWLSQRTATNLGFLGANSDALPVALFSASVAGLPFAPLNYRLTDDKLHAIAVRLAPAVVIADRTEAGRLAGIDGIEVIDVETFLGVVDQAPSPPTGEELVSDPESIAVLLFTSGTTGEPKGAVLRHRHLVSYIIGTVEFLSAEADEAQLIAVPGYHIAGISAVLSCLYAGRRMVYEAAFEPAEWVATLRDERITQAMVVPTMLGRILSVIEADGLGLPSLRHLSYGGGRMPIELIERALDALPEVNFVNAYGLTETSSTVSVLTPADHRQAVASDDPSIRRRLGSVGRPLPTVEVEVRGLDGRAVGPLVTGEIHVRGEQVAGEYLGGTVLSDEGWFATRDAGWVDEDGYLFLDGRLDDVIVRGAENLSPGEIEEVLLSHPSVEEAAVVGIPDPEWGEAVAAAVVLRSGAEASAAELQEWVRQRLRSTKTPSAIQFRRELPHNETGKLLRRVLREEISMAPSGGVDDER